MSSLLGVRGVVYDEGGREFLITLHGIFLLSNYCLNAFSMGAILYFVRQFFGYWKGDNGREMPLLLNPLRLFSNL
jgi:hypothetical protein